MVIESWEQGQAEDVRRIQKLVRGHELSIALDDLILVSDPPATLSDNASDTRVASCLTDRHIEVFEAKGAAVGVLIRCPPSP